ncbi:hypothetical protein MVEN_00306400 [Mycena venus]|uniref:Uncharacterized protein n=1 Tax=Mycena venus TaxID=2733690 RepID=A0A8H7DE83_9AGAR|nr:hypothetical protein MVEN_00306400 [Mycena venus]
MHAAHLISLMLVSFLALVTANPLATQRDTETCGCESPTGCPGRCSGNSQCVDYCGMNTTVFCDACGETSLGCILNDNGSCFTVNE